MTEIHLRTAKFNTSQRFAGQAWTTQKKGCFSNVEILEMCGHENREENEQEPLTRIEIQNTEKQQFLNRIET